MGTITLQAKPSKCRYGIMNIYSGDFAYALSMDKTKILEWTSYPEEALRFDPWSALIAHTNLYDQDEETILCEFEEGL